MAFEAHFFLARWWGNSEDMENPVLEKEALISALGFCLNGIFCFFNKVVGVAGFTLGI